MEVMHMKQYYKAKKLPQSQALSWWLPAKVLLHGHQFPSVNEMKNELNSNSKNQIWKMHSVRIETGVLEKENDRYHKVKHGVNTNGSKAVSPVGI